MTEPQEKRAELVGYLLGKPAAHHLQAASDCIKADGEELAAQRESLIQKDQRIAELEARTILEEPASFYDRWREAEGRVAALRAENAELTKGLDEAHTLLREAVYLVPSSATAVYGDPRVKWCSAVARLISQNNARPAPDGQRVERKGDPGIPGTPATTYIPQVEYNADLKLTTIILRDTFVVWSPWTAGGTLQGHAVDCGYDGDTGELVGIQIWDDVRRRPAQPDQQPASEAAANRVPAGVQVTEEMVRRGRQAILDNFQWNLRDDEVACILKAALRSQPSPAPGGEYGEPVAWRYELAHAGWPPDAYSDWRWHITASEPHVPEGSIRNLTPLYAAPQAAPPVGDGTEETT